MSVRSNVVKMLMLDGHSKTIADAITDQFWETAERHGKLSAKSIHQFIIYKLTMKDPNWRLKQESCDTCGGSVDEDGYGECEECHIFYCAEHNKLEDGRCPDCITEIGGENEFNNERKAG